MLDGERWPNVSGEMEDLLDQRSIPILNKSDLLRDNSLKLSVKDKQLIRVSCKTGEGLEQLKDTLKRFLEIYISETSLLVNFTQTCLFLPKYCV